MSYDFDSVLAECLIVLRNCVADGFQEYHTQYTQVSAKHHARTRSSIVHDHIVALAKERLREFPSVRFLPKAIRNLFDVKGKVVIQFKKLNPKLLPSNYPTQLALAFDKQETVNGLPGIPPTLPRLTVGYVPNRDSTGIAGIFVTYCVGENLKWYMDITDLGGEANVLPMQPVLEPPQEVQQRVYAKGKKRKGGASDAVAGV